MKYLIVTCSNFQLKRMSNSASFSRRCTVSHCRLRVKFLDFNCETTFTKKQNRLLLLQRRPNHSLAQTSFSVFKIHHFRDLSFYAILHKPIRNRINKAAMSLCKRLNKNGGQIANQKQHFETTINVPEQVSTFCITLYNAHQNLFRSVVARKFQLEVSTCNFRNVVVGSKTKWQTRRHARQSRSAASPGVCDDYRRKEKVSRRRHSSAKRDLSRLNLWDSFERQRDVPNTLAVPFPSASSPMSTRTIGNTSFSSLSFTPSLPLLLVFHIFPRPKNKLYGVFFQTEIYTKSALNVRTRCNT